MEVNERLTIRLDDGPGGGLLIFSKRQEVIGHLTARHALTKELVSGRHVLFARLTGLRDDGITIRVTTGDPGDTLSTYHDEWHQRITQGLPRQHSQLGKAYRVNVVGESYRQAEISRTKVGQGIRLLHDARNSFDTRAIMVVTTNDEQIGFLPRNGWLTRALLDEQCDYVARIAEIHPKTSERAFAAVILDVTLS